MIGVKTKSEDRKIVEEFFQLFKTPWEFYKHGRQYDVLLLAGEDLMESDSALVVAFKSKELPFDLYQVSNFSVSNSKVAALWEGTRIRIYGRSVAFLHAGDAAILWDNSGGILGYETRKGNQRILRIGYDLFKEISFLLTSGQTIENAQIPTLDIHIAMLRRWILESGISLFEIPPVPAGYNFIACLTHDVDFISIRRHFLDHSMFGFLYRATLKSMNDFIRNEASFLKLRENLKAVLRLPIVLLGIGRDPWNQFDRYLELEGGAPSTFFFIPYKNYPGEGFNKKSDKFRAAKYDIDDVRDIIAKLQSHGCEACVHGLDAWKNVERGRKELERLRSVAGQNSIGIRVHWLCQNESTFRILEQSGYSYDSSFGYNETVGFRAGTSQVFKPIGVKHLLELPLHIQDTALFNSARMNLSEDHATQLCDQVIDSVAGVQGVITLLWHQRSIGPERLWGQFYLNLINKLKARNAWFATSGDIVSWFRIRRNITFTNRGEIDYGRLHEIRQDLPGLVLRRNGKDEYLLIPQESKKKKKSFKISSKNTFL